MPKSSRDTVSVYSSSSRQRPALSASSFSAYSQGCGLGLIGFSLESLEPVYASKPSLTSGPAPVGRDSNYGVNVGRRTPRPLPASNSKFPAVLTNEQKEKQQEKEREAIQQKELIMKEQEKTRIKREMEERKKASPSGLSGGEDGAKFSKFDVSATNSVATSPVMHHDKTSTEQEDDPNDFAVFQGGGSTGDMSGNTSAVASPAAASSVYQSAVSPPSNNSVADKLNGSAFVASIDENAFAYDSDDW